MQHPEGGNENAAKERLAAEDLSGLRPAVHLAQEMGPDLAHRPVLLGALPADEDFGEPDPYRLIALTSSITERDQDTASF